MNTLRSSPSRFQCCGAHARRRTAYKSGCFFRTKKNDALVRNIEIGGWGRGMGEYEMIASRWLFFSHDPESELSSFCFFHCVVLLGSVVFASFCLMRGLTRVGRGNTFDSGTQSGFGEKISSQCDASSADAVPEDRLPVRCGKLQRPARLRQQKRIAAEGRLKSRSVADRWPGKKRQRVAQ